MHAFDADWQPVRRAVPARLLVDAAARPRALRERGARQARRSAARPGGHPAPRHARRAHRRRRAPADGRRPRRRLPLRRPGLEPRRRHRRARCSPTAARRLQTFAVGTRRLARPRRRAPGRRAHRRPQHHETTYTAEDALEVAAARSCARSSPSTPASSAARCRTSCSPALTARARQGRAHRRGRRRAVRRLRVPARVPGARRACTPSSSARLRSLHNLNLQRCDRVTMAHGLEARVPFLDREVIEWAMRLPAEAQASPGRAGRRSGCCARRSTGWLPHDLLWREKAEFGDGSGARDVLSAAVEAQISDGRVRGRARRGRRRRCARARSSPTTASSASTSRGVRAEVAISRHATA